MRLTKGRIAGKCAKLSRAWRSLAAREIVFPSGCKDGITKILFAFCPCAVAVCV